MGNNLKEEFIDVIKLITKDVTNEVITNTTLKSLEAHIKKLQVANDIIKNIKYETVVKLAKIFNTSPEYLLGLDDNESEDIVISQEKLTKHNMAFFKAKDISDEDKKKMIESIQEFYYKQKYEKNDE